MFTIQNLEVYKKASAQIFINFDNQNSIISAIMKKEKLLLKLLSGNADANFDLSDLTNILIGLRFSERRSGGSHRIFYKEGINGIINLQRTANGKAKTYQVKQVRDFLVNNKMVGYE